MSVLEAKKLGIDFGGLTAVNNFDIKVEENDILEGFLENQKVFDLRIQ